MLRHCHACGAHIPSGQAVVSRESSREASYYCSASCLASCQHLDPAREHGPGDSGVDSERSLSTPSRSQSAPLSGSAETP